MILNNDDTLSLMEMIKYMLINNKLRLAWEFDDGDTWTLTFTKQG